MGPRQVTQGALFYEFSIEDHVPDDHLLRLLDRFVDLSDLRRILAPYYSSTGRPSIDPELMIRMLIVGYCFGIRSERRLCDEVHLNLAYRWFCRLDLADPVPDHSSFSKNRHGRFRDSDLFRRLFEPGFSICPPFAEHTSTKGGLPWKFRLGSVWDAVYRPRRAAKPGELTICGASPGVFGQGFPAASDAPRGSGVAADHTDTAAAGGSRRPLIRSRIPAKTRRGSAASANWNTA